MNEVVARATLKSNTFYNTGFIYIKEEVVEGVFTRDFVEMRIINKKLYLKLTQNILFKSNLFNQICSKKEISLFQTQYDEKTLYIPETYCLANDKGEIITLSIETLINNQDQVDTIIQKINEFH